MFCASFARKNYICNVFDLSIARQYAIVDTKYSLLPKYLFNAVSRLLSRDMQFHKTVLLCATSKKDALQKSKLLDI